MKLYITDSVSTVSQGMNTLSGNVDTIISSVNSYDVSSEDFPFSEAKAAIVTNVENAKTKIKNTNVLLDAVVKVHSELQDSAGSSSEIDSSSSSSSSKDNTTYSSPDTSGSSHKDSGGKSSKDNTNFYYGSNNGGGGDGTDSGSTPFYFAATGATAEVAATDIVASTDSILNVSDGATALLTDEVSVEGTLENMVTEEEYKELYKNYNVKEVSTANLATTVAKGMHIVVEGVSSDRRTFEYLKTVGTAAASYSATFEFVKLDAYATTSHGLLADKLDTNTMSDDKVNEFSFKSVLGTSDEKELSTGTASIVSESDSSLNSVHEAETVKINDEQAIKNLNKFKCAAGVTTAFTALPITFIIKNNIVLFFKCGYLTEKELTTALASAEVIPLVN